jgi:hypothetical protein
MGPFQKSFFKIQISLLLMNIFSTLALWKYRKNKGFLLEEIWLIFGIKVEKKKTF